MSFHVGQKVVCIKNYDALYDRAGAAQPVINSVYTIRDIRTFDPYGTGILLGEIHNPIVSTVLGPYERYFVIERFRPVVERQTDISIFTAMLIPSKERTEA